MKQMFRAFAVMVVVSIFISGCATTGVSEQVFNASVVGVNGYKEFIPVDPIESPRVTYYDNTGKSITKAWAQLTNKQIRDILPNIYTDISVAKRDISGNLTYLVAKATSEAGDYKELEGSALDTRQIKRELNQKKDGDTHFRNWKPRSS